MKDIRVLGIVVLTALLSISGHFWLWKRTI